MGHFPQRDEQFQMIAALKREYLDSDKPLFGIDTKKNECLRHFYRSGYVWSTARLPVNDHDFHGVWDGRIAPYGVCDPKRNTGHVTLGLNLETNEFACDSLALYWERPGHWDYHRARSLLSLCDCRGSNSPRHYIFLEDLQKLLDRIGIPIRVAHYAPYCSKCNPIERRMFSHITRACQGVVFHTLNVVKQLIERTWTSTGLSVTVAVIDNIYRKGRTASAEFMNAFPIQYHDVLPRLNYTVVPTV